MTVLKKIVALTAVGLFVASAAGATTLMNGDFETVDGRIGIENGKALNALGGTGKSSWDVYTSLPGGWTNPSRPKFGPGIEVQTTARWVRSMPIPAATMSNWTAMDVATTAKSIP